MRMMKKIADSLLILFLLISLPGAPSCIPAKTAERVPSEDSIATGGQAVKRRPSGDATAAGGKAVKIMPLGDSITAGGSSGARADPAYRVGYRLALWNKLRAGGYDIDFVGSQNSGSAVLADSDHEGHGGWRDDEILHGRSWEPAKGKLSDWLTAHRPDIVLLHIGTNRVDPSPDDVEGILNEIDNYSKEAWVVLALIINQSCSVNEPPCAASKTVALFNDNVAAMARDRINRLGDRIILVDMENGAGIDYHRTKHNPPGNMWDNFHPYKTGQEKMAAVWFSALEDLIRRKQLPRRPGRTGISD